MTEVTEFVIDRGTWLVGQTTAPLRKVSYLLADNGRMCCLGFYLKACGVEGLLGRYRPVEVSPPVPEWLVTDFESAPWNSIACTRLIQQNDNPDYSFAERERRIADGFATQGITVTFTGDYPEWVKERLSHA